MMRRVAAPPAVPRQVPAVRRARAGVYAMYAAEGLCFSSVLARIPHVQRAHGLTDGAINLLVALVPVVAILGGLCAARLAARLGSGAVLRFAQAPFYLCVILIGTVGPTQALVGTLVLFGMAVGMMEAAMNAQAVAIERQVGRSLVNGFFAVWSAASIVGSLWVVLANKLHLSLALGFLVPALAGLAITLVTGRMLLPKALEGRAPDEARLRAAARTVPWRPVLIIGAALGCAYIAEAAVSGFAVKYLGDELHSSDAVAPLAITAFALATLTGRAVADLAVRRWGAARIVRAGAIIAAAGLAAAVLATHPAVAIAGFAAVGFGLCSMAPSAYAAAGRHDHSGLGVAVARASVFNYLGFVAGSVLVAALQPVTSYRACYVIPALLMIVIVLLAGRFDGGPVASQAPASSKAAA